MTKFIRFAVAGLFVFANADAALAETKGNNQASKPTTGSGLQKAVVSQNLANSALKSKTNNAASPSGKKHEVNQYSGTTFINQGKK